MSADPVLSVVQASKRYRSAETWVQALDGVSLQANRGELIGILGPSGSGKSTLLLIAGLLEPPSQGEVWLNGQLVSHPRANLDPLRELRRAQIGFVFQKANLIPFLSAEENVAVALEIAGLTPRRARSTAREQLETLGLGQRTRNLPSQLSGGEQQRVAIARALAHRPAIILADEPTAALDSVRGRQIMELFREIATERGSAILVVTHDRRTLDVFDRVLELADGRENQVAA